MLRKLKLYGELAEFVGHKEFEIQVDSLGKAVSFLVNNFPQIEKYMNPQYYQVKVGSYAVDKEEIHHPIGQEDIHFIPVITGAGRGLGKILLGAALIAGAFIINPALSFSFKSGVTGFGALTGVSGAITKAAVYLGASLVLQGVSDMLFPLPKPKEFKSEQDPQLSFSFSGTQNTSRAGTPVPIVYGEIITGSVVISGAVDTQQVQA
ncbi:possible bacteriophage tail protein [uncultured phage MedDCM-OCT-S08-C232]|nr:possible bacteriophage tail protein [uncultured phage MedDCM-OCT-S08-C232]